MSNDLMDMKWAKWRDMPTEKILEALKHTYALRKNDIYFPGQTQIAGLCAALIPKIEKLLEYEKLEEQGLVQRNGKT